MPDTARKRTATHTTQQQQPTPYISSNNPHRPAATTRSNPAHLHEIDVPLLQRFRKDGVVGERKGARHNRPGVLPRQALNVHQHALKLRHRQRRVRVVELDRNHVGELGPRLHRHPGCKEWLKKTASKRQDDHGESPKVTTNNQRSIHSLVRGTAPDPTRIASQPASLKNCKQQHQQQQQPPPSEIKEGETADEQAERTLPVLRKRRITSWRVAQTKKYCCLSRSSLPVYVLSFGYSTAEMSSLRRLASIAAR